MKSPISHLSRNIDTLTEPVDKKEPGVYVRGQQGGSDELDYLWGKERLKEKDPTRFLGIYFLGGLGLGFLVGVSMALFLVYQTPLFPPNRAVDAAGPIIEHEVLEEDTASPVPETTEAKAPSSETIPDKPENFVTIIKDEMTHTKQPAKTPTKPSGGSSATASGLEQVKTHTIQSGDTLEGIALKYYNSRDPKYAEKIQRANNLNPTNMKLGQKITIPPKSY